MFMPKSNSPCPLDDQTTDCRRFNHELRQLTEQINRYHHAPSDYSHKLTSPPSPRYC